MDAPNTATLLNWLIWIALAIAIWLVLSPPAYIAKVALRGVGFLELPRRAAAWASRFASFRDALDRFLARLVQATETSGGSDSVRVALDERHARLKDALRHTEREVRASVADIEGVASQSGPNSVLSDVDALKDRCKLVDQIAVDFDEDLESKYVARTRAQSELIIAGFLVLVFATLNSGMLNLFFSDLIPYRFAGVPLSLIVALMFVAAEMALGSILSWTDHRGGRRGVRWFWIGVIGLLAVIEAIILAIVSNGFELEFAIFQDHPALKSWLGLFGPALVAATSSSGYMLHHAIHDLAEYRGASRMKRELREANAFVAKLPAAWENIDMKAQRARSSIDSYLLALKGKEAELGGVVSEIRRERESLSGALLTVNPTTWASSVSGEQGDIRSAGVMNIGLFLITLAALIGYSAATSFLVLTAAGTRLPAYVSVGGGVLVALAFFAIGLLPFRRLRLTTGDNGRAYPISAGPVEYGVFGAVVTCCLIGLAWASVTALGGWGVALGVLLVGAGGLLSVLGYFMERSMRGMTLALTAAVLIVSLLARTLVAALGFLVVWVFVITSSILIGGLAILAKPLELLIEALRKRELPSRTGEAS